MKIKLLHPSATAPEYATPGSACFDLRAVERVHLNGTGGLAVLARTGLAFEIPAGHVMLIFARSGLAFNNGVRPANCVGVIDSDYRGEIMVPLVTDVDSEHDVVLPPGSRIAQGMILPVDQHHFRVVDELGETSRGAGGFGSTGV